MRLHQLIIGLFTCCSAFAQSPIWTGQALWVGGAYPPVSSSGAIYTGIFVDSVAGNDSTGTGLSNAPFASIAKAYTVNNGGKGWFYNTNVYLKRGSLFREPLFAGSTNVNNGDPVTGVYAYGYGLKPIISGADLMSTNWTLLAGATNTYFQYSNAPVFVWTNKIINFVTTRSNVMMFWDNSQRMGDGWFGNTYGAGFITNISQLDSDPGCFYYSKGTNWISPFAGEGSPVTNGHVYERSVRDVAVHGYDHCFFRFIVGEKSYATDGGNQGSYELWGDAGGIFDRCIARYGSSHLAGVANTVYNSSALILSNVYIYDGENIPVDYGTLFVGYKDLGLGITAQIYLTNCTVENPYVPTSYAEGFFGHDNLVDESNGIPDVLNTAAGCYAINLSYGFDVSALLIAPVNNTAISCFAGIIGFQATNESGFQGFNCVNGISGATTNTTIVNSLFVDCVTAIPNIRHKLYATNDYFLSVTDSSASAFSCAANFVIPTNTITSVSNLFTVFNAYNGAGSNSMNYADYNDYYGVVQIGSSIPGAYYTFSAWTSQYPSFDVHGSTAAPTVTPNTTWTTNAARAVCADGPMRLIDPASQSILLTNSVSFGGLAAGIDTIGYYWLTNGVQDGTSSGTNYTIASVSTNMNGETFYFIATNDIYACTSAVATLTVTNPLPPFVYSPTNQYNSGPAFAWWPVTNNYTTNSGTAILSDLTGNGYNLTNSVAGKIPARTVGDTLTFLNANNTYLQNLTFAHAQPLDIFMVMSVTNISGLRAYYFAVTSGNSFQWDALYFNMGGNTVATGITNKLIVLQTRWSSNEYVSLATNNIFSTPVFYGGSPWTGGIVLGDRAGGSQSVGYSGTFAFKEMIAFTNLSAVDSTNCYNYLTNKYGITP